MRSLSVRLEANKTIAAIQQAQQRYLRGDSVRARGEELGDARRVEAVLGEADRRPEPRAASPHHHRVVRVVHHRVGRLQTNGISRGILVPSGPHGKSPAPRPTASKRTGGSGKGKGIGRAE